MRIKFINTCHDKNNGRIYHRNDIVEFDDQRAQEIIDTGYAQIVEEQIEYDVLSKKELQGLAKKSGVAIRGTKKEIIERLKHVN